jgi:hypothetical protein
MKAGFYRLTKPIDNPDADRRTTNDWTRATQFKPGIYEIRCNTWVDEVDGKKVEYKGRPEIRRLNRYDGRSIYGSLYADSDCRGGSALAVHLEPWPEDEIILPLILNKLQSDLRHMMIFLIEEKGLLTWKELSAYVDEMNAMDDSWYDESSSETNYPEHFDRHL